MKIILLLMILFHCNNAFAITKNFLDDPYNDIEPIDINFDYSFKSTDENLNLDISILYENFCENDKNINLSISLLGREEVERNRSLMFFINTYNQYLNTLDKQKFYLEFLTSNVYFIYKATLLVKCLENDLSNFDENGIYVKLSNILSNEEINQKKLIKHWENNIDYSLKNNFNFFEKILLNSNNQVLEILSIENFIRDGDNLYEAAKRILETRKKGEEKFIIDWGDYYALMIGNSDYDDDKFVDLDSPLADLKLIGETLNSKYQFEKIQYLENDSKEQILDTLYSYRNIDKYNSNKSLLIYYAGHGDWDEATGEGYWQPKDADIDRPSTWIPNSSISRELKALPFKHIIIIADSCYSGTWTGTKSSVKEIPKDPDARKKWLKKLNTLSVRVALTSGNIDVVPDTLDNSYNSPFATALNNALLLNNDDILFSYSLYDDVIAQIQYSDYFQLPTYGGIVGANHSSKGFFIFVPTN